MRKISLIAISPQLRIDVGSNLVTTIHFSSRHVHRGANKEVCVPFVPHSPVEHPTHDVILTCLSTEQSMNLARLHLYQVFLQVFAHRLDSLK